MGSFDLEKGLAKISENDNFTNFCYKLYKEFSKTEIETMEDLYNSFSKFDNLIRSNADVILKYYPKVRYESVINRIDTFGNHWNYLIGDAGAVQQKFVDIIKRSADISRLNILDVGPGDIPFSSILIGQNAKKAYAMDENFFISSECLDRFNVKLLEEMFEPSTNVSDYDMIVGKCPCSAIDAIVYLCAKHNKPYVIETCDCCMPSIKEFNYKWTIQSEENNDDTYNRWYGWMDMLPALDPNIASYGDMVYHVEDNDGLTRYLQARAEKLKAEKKENSKENISCTTVVMNVSMADPRLADTSDEKEID